MHLGILSVLLCLLGTALSFPLQERDFTSMERSILRYKDSLQDLLGAIYRLDRDLQGDVRSQGQYLEQKCNAVTSTLRLEASTIPHQARLERMDAIRLVTPTNAVATVQNQVSKAWILQRDTVVRAGGREAVYRCLRRQVDAYGEYNDAVLGRLPGDMGIGKGVSAISRKWLDDAVEAFK